MQGRLLKAKHLRLGLTELTEGAEESIGDGVMLATPEMPLSRLMPNISSVMVPARDADVRLCTAHLCDNARTSAHPKISCIVYPSEIPMILQYESHC